jgi:ureidoglycolate lyase
MTNCTIEIALEPLTPEAFAPFGTILSPEGRARLPVNTYGDALSLYREGFETDQPIEWFIVQGRPRPMEALFLERHLQITQAFLPLGGQGFVMLVARPDAETEPDGMIKTAETRAFHAPGTVGIQLHRGTWHENPFPLAAGQVFLVTSHAALTRGHQTNPRADLADLPLDLERRFYAERNVTLRIIS